MTKKTNDFKASLIFNNYRKKERNQMGKKCVFIMMPRNLLTD